MIIYVRQDGNSQMLRSSQNLKFNINPSLKEGFFIIRLFGYVKKISYNWIMEMNVIIGKVDYLITDESTIHQGEDLVFEVRTRSNDNSEETFVVGSFDDLLGAPIKKVWKIIGQTPVTDK